jgi:hypothetical protein
MRVNIFDLPLPWGPWRNAMFAMGVKRDGYTMFGERHTGYVIEIISDGRFGLLALLPSRFGINIEIIHRLDG